MSERITTSERLLDWAIRKRVHARGKTPPIIIQAANRRGTYEVAVQNPMRARL